MRAKNKGVRMNDEPAKGALLLGPACARAPWVAWGLLIQVLGAASVAAVLWRGVRNQGIAAHVTAEMIKLAWRSELHTRTGLIALVAGSVVYAAGSVVMARPYISSPVMLFVAVPAAAVAGMLVLGVLALVVAALVAVLVNTQDNLDFGLGEWPVRRRRQR